MKRMHADQGRILVTGANGFVGASALAGLTDSLGDRVIGTARRPVPGSPFTRSPSLDAQADWSSVLDDVCCVVHCAARVHVMREKHDDPLAEFRRINVAGTLALARQAAAYGVRRFVFLSSIKVNGEQSSADRPFTSGDIPAPQDPYGVSKLEAECGLTALAHETGMEVVIVRPPLVYGPGVGANFLSMMRWLHRGLPLPLGAIPNRRSLVALDNLVDLILKCVDHPAAANATFLVSDGEDLSTPELLRRTGKALGKRARLFSVPQRFLETGAAIAGKRGVAERLCGSLQVNIDATRLALGWEPPVTVDDALERTAHWFLERRAR